VAISAQSPVAMQYANEYGMIVSIGSIGLFLEGHWTKVLQSEGNMKLPMIAQIVGAVTNIILDPLLIFTAGLGIKGAAIATVIGQIAAAVIVGIKGARKPPEIKR
ncbi:polysaccharide biosynthesis C-terminal domain-containing protein, partial [[Eubacterium] siraeum]|nr:polysaccharide biosynthesis C-terminal domain-containing protein [[Eubacterium] siraeum]